MRTIAEEKFHGVEKYNCAQAILSAFQEKYSVSNDLIAEHKKFGGGRAEGNMCGALYAANHLETTPEKQAEMAKLFMAQAGSLKCKEIKQAKTLSCKECVGVTADILESLA